MDSAVGFGSASLPAYYTEMEFMLYARQLTGD
jgi:hypothetical protein